MKLFSTTNVLAAILPGILLLACLLPLTAQVSNTDHLVLQKGKILVVKNGKPAPLEEDIVLANGVKVMTNGTFTLPGGKEKPLRENQKITLDGFLIGQDGRLLQLEDHLTLRNGKVTLIKDGQSRPVTGQITLKDGTRVLPNGIIYRPNGKRSRLLDGQMLKLHGANLPANDFVMMQKGKVVLQKDGSIITLAPRRSMMMADGTKVKGNGTVIKRDGTRLVLKEGQRLNLKGAIMPKAR